MVSVVAGTSMRLAALSLIALLLPLRPLRAQASLPQGWSSCGTAGAIASDTAGPWAGRRSLVLVAHDDGTAACAVQSVDATPLRRQRVWLRGMLRGQLPSRSGGLWVRVVGSSVGTLFSMMSGRHPRLGNDWRPFRVSVFVPADATALQFGATIFGPDAALWMDALRLETAADSAPSRNSYAADDDPMPIVPTLPAPTNMSFEN